MSITKKVLMIGIGSTIAVGGITTAIAVPLSQRQTETEKLPVSIPSTPLTPAKNIQQALNKLTIDSIVFKNKKEIGEFKKEENFAFNIETSQLSLKDEDKNTFPSWTTFEFKINQGQNKVVDLNKGILNVELVAKVEGNVIRTKTFKIEGFKAVSEQNSKLVTTTNDKVILDLSKVETNTYRSIETLNKLSPVTPTLKSKDTDTPANQKQESGLSALLQKLTLKGQEAQKPNPKEWNIEGEVKLNKLSLNEDKTNFHLVSGTNNKYLKLVNTKQDVNEEIIVDEIVVTNLLASNISVKPAGLDVQENEAFVNEFGSESDSGYKAIEENKKVQLEVKKNADQIVVSTLSVNPYLIEKKEKNQEIKANLLVSFGTGETIKTYDLSVEEQLNELKTAGFGFNVYVKKFDSSNEKILKALTLTTGSELDTYFEPKNFSIPTMVSNLEMTSGSMPKGGFTKIELKPDALAKEFKLGTAEKVQTQNPPQLDSGQETPIDENWVVFASYSYKGMMDKALLTPTIDVIHLEVKKPTTTGPVVENAARR